VAGAGSGAVVTLAGGGLAVTPGSGLGVVVVVGGEGNFVGCESAEVTVSQPVRLTSATVSKTSALVWRVAFQIAMALVSIILALLCSISHVFQRVEHAMGV
jgi:hypothetical protein